MSDKHTPTPWEIPIYDNDTGPNDEGFYEWFEIPGVGKFDKFSNAIFVHRACNAHDDLVEALKMITAEAKLDGLDKRPGWDCWVAMADEALALAKGE